MARRRQHQKQAPAPPASNWFILGREPLLSAAEIFSVLQIPFGQSDAYEYQPPILRVRSAGVQNFEPLRDAEKFIARIGGTIKIAEEIAHNLSEEELIERMVAELERIEGKIHFGISWYSPNNVGVISTTSAGRRELPLPAAIEQWGREIKQQLKEKGRSVRYVFKDELTLSSVTVEQNKLVEKGREFLVRGGVGIDCNQYLLAITRAVQPFKEFSARDYGRPGRDDISGMLPPKLALIILNLAASSFPNFSPFGGSPGGRQFPVSNFRILDPFCGSGTILTEALLLGHKNLIGTDISEKAIKDTKQNIEWFSKYYSLLSTDYSLKLFQSDVLHLSKNLLSASVDAIITEPLLGPPLKGNEKIEQVKKTVLELNRLYFQAFREFKKILRPGGVVVFIFPRFAVGSLSSPARGEVSRGTRDGGEGVGGNWITISNRVVPDIEKLGFNVEPLLPKEIHQEPFVLYHREKQRVGREIWKFRFQF